MAFFIEELKEAFNKDVFLESKQCDCGECPECKAKEKEAMDEAVELTEKRNPENDEINTSLKKVAGGKRLTKKDKQALADRGYEYDEESKVVTNPKTGKKLSYGGRNTVNGPQPPQDHDKYHRKQGANYKNDAERNLRYANDIENKVPTDAELARDFVDNERGFRGKRDDNWSLADAREKKIARNKEQAKTARDDAKFYSDRSDRHYRNSHDKNRRDNVYRFGDHDLKRTGADDIDYAGYLDKEKKFDSNLQRQAAVDPNDRDIQQMTSGSLRPYSDKYKELTRDIDDARSHMNFQHKYYDDETLDKELADYEQELRDPKQGYSRYSPRLSDRVAQRDSRQRDMDAASKTMQGILDRARKRRASKNESLEEAVALTEKQNHENDEINKTIWKAATRNHKYLTDKEKKALADRGITLNDDGSLRGKGGRRLSADRTDVWGPSAPQSHEVNRSSWYYEPANKQQARNDYARRTWSNRRKEGDRLSKVDYAGYLDKPASEYDQDSRRADYLRLRYKGEDDAYQDTSSPESTVMRPYSDDYRKARQQYDDAKRWRDNYQKEIDDMSPEEAEIQQKLAAKRERNDRERANRAASKQRYQDAVAERDKFMADIRARKGRK